MNVQILQIVNIYLSISVLFILKNEEEADQVVSHHILRIVVPYEILLFGVQWVIFWRGTSFLVFFSKKNYLTLGVLILID
jgi:hypothetical protein